MNTDQILCGDNVTVLRGLPSACVQTCVTSPPYYGLRDYGTATWEGGSPECDHVEAKGTTRGGNYSTLQGGQDVTPHKSQYRDVCGKCGARRVDNQIGLESTPEQYVTRLVEVFREVWRVLKDDGTLWLNLGDSYAGSSMSGGDQTKRVGGGTAKLLQQHEENKSVKGVSTNFRDTIEGFIKGGVLLIGSGGALTISAEGQDILAFDSLAPDSELPSLFGVKRITIKQRDNNLCQVFDLLDPEAYRRISITVPFVVPNDTDAEIILDKGQRVSVIVSDHDLNTESSFGVAVRTYTAVNSDVPLTVKKSAKPKSKVIGNGKSAGDTVPLDSMSEGGLNINLINEPVALGNAFMPGAESLRDFSVTKASQEHVALSLMSGVIKFACGSVGHLYFSNSFGSLVRFSELYDKAKRRSNYFRPKQEIGIPFMVRQALMEDGWICRSTIIWNKPNPMPESVTDRPTKSHEYIFLLAKQPDYYCDMKAIQELSVTNEGRPHGIVRDREYGYDSKQAVLRSQRDSFKRNGSSRPDGLVPGNGKNAHRADRKEDDWDTNYRNKRSVWTVGTKPYAEAHFATFPPDLIKPCILAGSRAGDVVLDPFFGSGTTGFVARELGRHYIGIDLNPEYIKLAERRTARANVPLPGLV